MPEPKDTIELLQMHPGLFHSLQYLTEQERKPIKRTFVIGMPRSGTTLWMRLMEMACMSRCVGDKHESYFKGLLDMYHIAKKGGQYFDSLADAENKGLFPDEYRGFDSKQRELWNFHYAAANLLFANTFRSGYAKSTQIGFTNFFLVEFVEMLRDLFEKDDLTIVFMTRNRDAAARSLIEKNPGTLTEADLMNTIEAYDQQHAQMKQATRLGDVWIDFDKFVADPIPFLRRSNPLYLPNEAAVKRIMDKVIR
jgi:hypothetical protein